MKTTQKHVITTLFSSTLLFLLISKSLSAQTLCPGGGSNFSSVVMFQPSWIQGCTTGTSCNGGTNMDNRSSCESTTAIDACAPAPTAACVGTPSDSGSDLWFKFYPSSSSISIRINQNVSFYAVLQVFSGGPACNQLTEIGCYKALGPSQGFTLSLSGLSTSQLYYMRIFGNANNSSQRTGTFCFCGSTGLSDVTLPISIVDLKAEKNTDKKVTLEWSVLDETSAQLFEIQRSTDGENFETINQVLFKSDIKNYTFTDENYKKGVNFYRIKEVHNTGSYEFTKTVSINVTDGKDFFAYPNPARDMLTIEVDETTTAEIFDMRGAVIQKVTLNEGKNIVPLSNFESGLYFIHAVNSPKTYRFNVIK